MAMEQWKIGDILITKVEETEAWWPLDFWLNAMPSATRADVDAMTWLEPVYRRDEEVNGAIQSLLVETPEAKIVIDTGIGNHKTRLSPVFNQLDTDFLEKFEQVWRLEDVDLVVATHLHVDHVGWNTRLEGDTWVPTFPNARYLFVREEFDHWTAFVNDPHAGDAYSDFARAMVDGPAVFADSVRPIVDAGLVDWVEPGQQVVPGITLVSTPGHTPGHVSVLIESGGDSAVVTGDLFHSQAQISRPDWGAAMDSESTEADRTRRDFVERFADTSTIVIGSHFGTPTANLIVTDGSSYRLQPVYT